MRKQWVGLGATVLAVLVVLLATRRHGPAAPPEGVASAQQETAVAVDTLTVRSAAAVQTVDVTGTVKASLTADLAPKIVSKVANVLVREGDRVSRGQALVRLESADLGAQVRQAEAGVAAARAALSQAQTGSTIQRTQSSTRVAQARAALRQAEEQLSLVREGSRRQQKTLADEAVRQAEAGKAQADQGVQQAQAGVAAAQAQLSLVREGARRQQRAQADAAVRQAEANLKTAEATYNRFEPLMRDGVISKQRFDEIALQRDVARSQYETAREQASIVYEGARAQEVVQAQEAVRQAQAGLQAAQQKAREAEAAVRAAQAQRDLTYEGSRTQEIRQAEAQVAQAREALRLALAAAGETRIKQENVKMLAAQLAQAQANLVAARTQLAYATITAPFSGVVTQRHADPGAMASPGVPLITLVDPSAYRLEALVPESRVESIHLDDAARVRIDALDRTLLGRVRQIVPNADPASRSFIVKIGLPAAPGLAPGLFGRVSLVVGRAHELSIPESAVWRGHSLTGVYVVAGGTAHLRLVTLGKTQDGQVEVLSGLSPGETIATSGLDRLSDGAAVRARGSVG